MEIKCPVCGFAPLAEPPHTLQGGASFEICPACGYQHGFDDEDQGQSHSTWRSAWLERGAPWASQHIRPPAGWDAHALAASVAPKPGARNIVLTGATRGCGRALVRAFSALGHVVIACGRSASAIGQLRETFGPPHDFTALDVTDDEAVARWAARVCATHGAPELLVNNAAIIAPNAPLWKISDQAIRSVLDVNVRGTVNVLRHFIPAMIQNQRGVIVNFSSGWGRSTSPEVAIYCASKYAIEGLTQSLAQELPTGMAAIALNPGIIDTEMLRSCFGIEAANYPSPEVWARKAAPRILALSAKDNGSSLDVDV